MNEYRMIGEGRAERLNGRVLRHDGRVYINPTQEVLRAAGYKPLVRDPIPADAGQIDGEGNPIVYETVFTDAGDVVRLAYRRKECRDAEI